MHDYSQNVIITLASLLRLSYINTSLTKAFTFCGTYDYDNVGWKERK